MQREIRFRLINDGKVVGYEKHEGGKIWHKKWAWERNGFVYRPGWKDIMLPEDKDPIVGAYGEIANYIPHDRKDQYTGIEVDGVKVFDRDVLRWKDEILEVVWGSVGWDLTSELFRFPHQNHKDKPSCGEINIRGYLVKSEITGIEGVKP